MHTNIADQMAGPASRHATTHRSRKSFRHWLGGGMRRWQRHRMTVALQNLDDRLLDDIGLHRGDISQLVAQMNTRELQMAPVARVIDDEDDQPEDMPIAA